MCLPPTRPRRASPPRPLAAGDPSHETHHPRTMEVHVEDVLRNIRNPKVNLRYVLAELM